MTVVKPTDKLKVENANTQLAKILEDPESELLFAVTIYKEKVVGSVNKNLRLSEDEINELVAIVVNSFKENES